MIYVRFGVGLFKLFAASIRKGKSKAIKGVFRLRLRTFWTALDRG